MATIDLGKIRLLWRGDYDPTVLYEPQDMVRFERDLYICTVQPPIVGIVPTDVTFWSLMVERNGFFWQGNFNATVAYKRNDAVYYGRSAYFCTADTIAGALPTDPASWTLLAEGTSITVNAGDLIFRDMDNVEKPLPIGQTGQSLMVGPTGVPEYRYVDMSKRWQSPNRMFGDVELYFNQQVPAHTIVDGVRTTHAAAWQGPNVDTTIPPELGALLGPNMTGWNGNPAYENERLATVGTVAINGGAQATATFCAKLKPMVVNQDYSFWMYLRYGGQNQYVYLYILDPADQSTVLKALPAASPMVWNSWYYSTNLDMNPQGAIQDGNLTYHSWFQWPISAADIAQYADVNGYIHLGVRTHANSTWATQVYWSGMAFAPCYQPYFNIGAYGLYYAVNGTWQSELLWWLHYGYMAAAYNPGTTGYPANNPRLTTVPIPDLTKDTVLNVCFYEESAGGGSSYTYSGATRLHAVDASTGTIINDSPMQQGWFMSNPYTDQLLQRAGITTRQFYIPKKYYDGTLGTAATSAHGVENCFKFYWDNYQTTNVGVTSLQVMTVK